MDGPRKSDDIVKVNVPELELASLVADSSPNVTTAPIAPPVDPELMLAVSSEPSDEEL